MLSVCVWTWQWFWGAVFHEDVRRVRVPLWGNTAGEEWEREKSGVMC